MASDSLQSIADIFERKILRIPDYQRGYAWKEDQLKDLWEDIANLSISKKKHYTGVLTFEEIPQEVWSKWNNDKWLIETGYQPLYIVDGQQRVATIVILIQSIIETMEDNWHLNYQTKDRIKEKYISREFRDNRLLKTYIFGYEKDNPSYDFLKAKIYNDPATNYCGIQTLYTANLENAKKFFKGNLRGKSRNELEVIFKRVTQDLRFNEYKIEDELDVCIVFETMNNRGKQLSDLELMKNRLIYLTTLIKNVNNDERRKLRDNINEAWKTVYQYLGKNKDNPLDDDDYLRNHWIMYGGFDSKKTYSKVLLGEKFTTQNAVSGQITGINIDEYVRSLRDCVKKWYEIYNPLEKDSSLSEEEKQWLDKLNRLGYRYFLPLLMSVLINKDEDVYKKMKFLKSVERYIFLLFEISHRVSSMGRPQFLRKANEYYNGGVDLDTIIDSINEFIDWYHNIDGFMEHITEKFKRGEQKGYYNWSGLKYFLFEYEIDLHKKSGEKYPKITWDKYTKEKKNYTSVEHIYPQDPSKECWKKRFPYRSERKKILCNSLGNLVPLRILKNIAFQNNCFVEKKEPKEGKYKGYKYGSNSEIEIAEYKDWTPATLLKRGLKLLNFLEKRWGIRIGDENCKKKLLFLEFV